MKFHCSHCNYAVLQLLTDYIDTMCNNFITCNHLPVTHLLVVVAIELVLFNVGV